MAQYFNLSLDTTAPSNGVISGLQSYYKDNTKSVSLSADGASYMKVWFNQNATATLSDADVPANWEAYANSKQTAFTAQGTNYVHAVFMDNVGNIGSVVNSASCVFDSVAPSKPAAMADVLVAEGAEYVKEVATTVKVSIADATSYVDKVTLSGDMVFEGEATSKDFTLTDTDRSNGYIICNISFTAGDGNKQIYASATDIAGNTSSAIAGNVVELDQSPASANLYLRTSDDAGNLPSYINYYGFAAALETTDADVVSYKLWGDVVGATTEPSDWSPATFVSGRMLISDLQFTSGEGLKTVNAKIRDRAGNETTLTSKSSTVDTTAPIVTLTADKNVISAISGFDTVIFTGVATDTHDLTNYRLMLGETQIKAGSFTSGMTIAVTAAEIEAISSGEGSKSFVLKVSDVATNEGSSSAVAIALDKTAPTGTVTVDQYHNVQAVAVSISASDTGGSSVSKMKVWLDNNEAGASYIDYAATYQFTNVAEGQHAAHVKFKDAVGNESAAFDSSNFIVDITAPHLVSATIAGYTKSRTFAFTFEASDSKEGVTVVSGMNKMKVWQSGGTEPAAENYAGSKTLELTGDDGTKTIVAKFQDNAGNWSDQITLGSTILDLDAPDAQIALYKADSVTPLPAKVNARGFVAHISATDTQISPITQYKLTGDFDQSSTEWKTYQVDTGKSYMTIADLTLTTGDALKTITLVLKDAAGNESTPASATVTLDTAAPVIDVTNPDYNVVSKQHTNRLNADGTVISGKFNDTCIFTFSCGEKLAEYKVCVNEAEQTAEGAVAIGTTYGSQNMTGTNVEANTTVTCTIMAKDFAATSKVDDKDGAYEVIVYGKDEGGTWSAIKPIV